MIQEPPSPADQVDDITARRRLVARLCPEHAVALSLRLIRSDGTQVFGCSWSRCLLEFEVRVGRKIGLRG